MKTTAGPGRRSVVGKAVYVGIDVHKESWQVTVRTDGEEIFNGSGELLGSNLYRLLKNSISPILVRECQFCT
jgi:hypothetical protein